MQVIPFRAHDWYNHNGRAFRKPKPLPETTAARVPFRKRASAPKPVLEQVCAEIPDAPKVAERKPVQTAVPATFAARVAALMATGVSYQQAAERVQDEATA